MEKLSYPIPSRRFFLIRSKGADEFFELALTSGEKIILALALTLTFVLEEALEERLELVLPLESVLVFALEAELKITLICKLLNKVLLETHLDLVQASEGVFEVVLS